MLRRKYKYYILKIIKLQKISFVYDNQTLFDGYYLSDLVTKEFLFLFTSHRYDLKVDVLAISSV